MHMLKLIDGRVGASMALALSLAVLMAVVLGLA